jgi:hypothetical protein
VVEQAYGSTLNCYCFVYHSCHSWILTYFTTLQVLPCSTQKCLGESVKD